MTAKTITGPEADGKAKRMGLGRATAGLQPSAHREATSHPWSYKALTKTKEGIMILIHWFQKEQNHQRKTTETNSSENYVE